eukprot:TRINITY_DN2313_c0_g1_i1.p1 TRINITY_DN2313_c0_g1~~TRINITY_DN2313_c0_g1_i1.p1  ORF type:complete len:154 (+),score=50.16 TRINITY_DN2313_c0_g1_i1:71-463(+)
MSNKCPSCGKTVYFAERVVALGKDFHKICLKCSQCSKKLEPGNFSDRDEKLFCKGCYAKTGGGATGYGFWSGASGVGGKYGEEDKRGPVGGGAGGAAAADATTGGKFCAQCGTSLPPNAKFCSSCGTTVG